MCLLTASRFLRTVTLGALCVAPLAAAITPTELAARLARNEPILVIDVRTATAYADGHIPGAINIPSSLLPHKPLPTAPLIVLCGDGLGAVAEAAALAAARSKPNVTADVLVGGYAAWLADTRLSTDGGGVVRERIPGITYDQLLAAANTDVVLVDLTTAATTANESRSGSGLVSAALTESDLVDGFARKLGVPVLKGTTSSARSELMHAQVADGTTPAVTNVQSLNQPGKLLVLVANSESQANETARVLRSLGRYRFTVLVGGTDAIRHEGKTGSDRLVGNASATPGQP